MVDPKFVTKFDRTDAELEEFAIFSVCVAGKDAKIISKAVDKLCYFLCLSQGIDTPLKALYYRCYHHSIPDLAANMKYYGIGCHTGTDKIPGRAEVCFKLSEKLIFDDVQYLRKCTAADLMSIKGIGFKTANFFLMHTRQGYSACAPDTHILKFLNACGIKAPKVCPPKTSKRTIELQDKFIAIAKLLGKSTSELDLEVWNHYSRNGLGSNPQVQVYIDKVKAAQL